MIVNMKRQRSDGNLVMVGCHGREEEPVEPGQLYCRESGSESLGQVERLTSELHSCRSATLMLSSFPLPCPSSGSEDGKKVSPLALMIWTPESQGAGPHHGSISEASMQ